MGRVPSDVNMVISACLFPLLMFGAAMGGSLTYNHGVGLSLGRKKIE